MLETIKALFAKSSTALAVRPSAAIELYVGSWTRLHDSNRSLVALRCRCNCGTQFDYTDFSEKALKLEHRCPKCGTLHCAAASPNMVDEYLGKEKAQPRAMWVGDDPERITWSSATERYRPADDPADFGMARAFANPRSRE